MGDGGSPAAVTPGVRRSRNDMSSGGVPAAAATPINLSVYGGTGSAPAAGSQVPLSPEALRARQTRIPNSASELPANPTTDTKPILSSNSAARLPNQNPGGPPGSSTSPRPTAWTPPVIARPSAPVPNPWSETDGQGNPSGVGKFRGEEWVRDGSWWVKKSIVDANPGILSTPKGENPANDRIVESNRVSYSDGLTTMVSEQRAAQQGAPAGSTNTNFGYENSIPPEELARRRELAGRLGVNPKAETSPKATLAEELYYGHYDEIPGMGVYFSFHGGPNPWTFKDSNGNEVTGNPQMIAAAQKAENARQYRLNQGSGGGGAPPPLLARGALVKKKPGGHRLNINGQAAIVGEGTEDEAVLPLSVLSSVVEAAAARGAGRNVSASAPLLSVHAGSGKKVPKLASGGVLGRGRNIVAGEPTPGGGFGGFSGGGGASGGKVIGNALGPESFGNYTPGTYSPYQKQQMSPQEQAQLAAITKIAQQLSGRGEATYNIGSGAYADAVKYFQTLTKGNRGQMMAAVAPSAELIREQGEGAKGAVLAGQGRSGLRDLALSGIDRQSQGDIARLTAGVQPGAAGSLGALGGQGIQLGNQATEASGQLSSAAQQALTQSRQFEEGLGESSRQFGAGLEEGSRQFGAGLAENSRQFQANLTELQRSNMMNESQAAAAMAMQQQLMSQNYQMAQQQFQESIRQFNAGLSAQRSANRGQAIGAGIAAVATIAVLI